MFDYPEKYFNEIMDQCDIYNDNILDWCNIELYVLVRQLRTSHVPFSVSVARDQGKTIFVRFI